ncbi:MAG: TVP38/TMEM64 family protein [Nitrospirota bacterium]
MKAHKGKLILIAFLIGGALLFRVLGIDEYVTFERLKEHKETLGRFVQDRYLVSVVGYILIYIVFIGLSLPGGAVLTVAGGFLFGTVLGMVYVNIAATAGACIAFLLSRHLIGSWVQQKYRRRIEKFNEEFARNGHRYLLVLRLIPVFPFFLVNLFAGITTVPFRTFLWTTSLGIIPGSAIYAFAGDQIEKIDSVNDIVTMKVMVTLLLLAFLVLAPLGINYLKCYITKKCG